MYSKLEELIIKAATKTDYTQELQEVIKLYGADFNASDFETHLELLGQMKIEINFHLMTFISTSNPYPQCNYLLYRK